jgi:AAA family ATP:ADP antiporter
LRFDAPAQTLRCTTVAAHALRERCAGAVGASAARTLHRQVSVIAGTANTWRIALAPAAVLFTVMVAHALLETARDALLITHLGLHGLALAYIAIAVIALVAVTAVRRWGGVRDPRRMLLLFLITATTGTTALAATIAAIPSLAFVLYVWTGVVATLVVPTFWTVIDRSAKVVEAKRLFGVIAAGGGLGAMLGSLAASGLGRAVPAHLLVTAGAIAFAAATVTAFILTPRDTPDAPPPRPHARKLTTSHRRYVQLLIAFAIVSTIALTIGDLVFKRVIADRLPAEQLATTFGAIYAVLNLLALVVQLVIAPWLLARWGVGSALAVLPIVLLVGGLGFAISGALTAILLLKLGDGTLRHSLHRVTSEILYLPIPSRLRDGWKPIADAVGQRGGQAIAALIALAFIALDAGPRALAVIVAITALGWLVIGLLARRAYLRQFGNMLREGEVLRDAHVPALDGDSLEVLTETLSSPDEVEAIASLDLLARSGRIPALVLYHPNVEVVKRALELVEGKLHAPHARVLAHLMEHTDARIRAAALIAASRTGSNRELLLRSVDDPDPEVRAAALVATHADVAALAAFASGTSADRIALARAIGFAPSERVKPIMYLLLEPRDPGVVREVLRVLAREPSLAELSRIVSLIEDPRVRVEARRVFLSCGGTGLDFLVAALDDPRTPLGVRRHLPRSISRFASARAAAALASRLLREPDSATEFKILRALGRMRANDPELRLDLTELWKYVRRSIADAARYATLLDGLADHADATAGSELLGELLVEKRGWALEHAFRALGILHPDANMRVIHGAFTGTDQVRRDAAREVLESLLASDLREPLFAMIDELTAQERRERLGRLASGPFHSAEELVAALLADPSGSLKCVAAHHAAERNLVSLRSELARLRPLGGAPLITDAFDQAIERLDG